MPALVFVTVGTTRFDELLSAIDTVDVQSRLKHMFGSLEIRVQRGKSSVTPCGRVDGVRVTSYDFKPDLIDDIKNSDFVISHCGAGTVLEVLRLKKKACVVINESLLGNHQVELAGKLAEENLAVMCRSPSNLHRVLSESNWEGLRIYDEPRPDLFVEAVSQLISI